jgi:hypothetical protein
MIFIYEKSTGEIKAFYKGDIPQIHNYGDEAKEWAEAQFPDDPAVIQNPHAYKIVTYNGLPIAYQKKPELKLTVDKETIFGNGEDVAVLKVEITNIHPLEVDRYKEAKIRINGEETIVGNGEEIELASYGVDIIVEGDINTFRGDMMRRKIVVGKKPSQTEEAKNEITTMQEKLRELEEKINQLSQG